MNVFFFFYLLIDVFFHVDSKSDIRIFRTALVFELGIGRKKRHNKRLSFEVFFDPKI